VVSAVDLAQLLDPVDLATFKRDYWESKPLVSCTNEASRFEEVLSLSAVDDILCHSSLRSDDVRIARNGEATPVRELFDADTNASEGGLEALYQEYRKGSSIVLLFLHERWSPVKTLCQSLSSELSSRVQANVYLTPPGAQALDTHYDTHDVLVLQIHGKKQWRLFEPTLPLPLSHQRYSVEENMSLGAPKMEVTLSPGDLMYLPRGYPHDAVSVDVASLHLTVGVIPVTWASVILRAVQKVIDENSMLRRSLPPGFASDPNLQAEIVTRIPELMMDVLKGIDVRRAIDEARASALLGRQPSLAGHLVDLELLPRLASDTLVQRRKDVEVSVIAADESISVVFHGKRIDFPPYVESDIWFIVEAEEFRPCELPGDLDQESRLVLVSRLLTEGLLMIDRIG
jgi:ribosomal protein L16 Arg81 hydroxylase